MFCNKKRDTMKCIHTHREEYVLKFYKRMKIYKPEDIDLKYISRRLYIYLKWKNEPSRSEQFGRYRAIILQKGLDKKEERLHFFHELGHLLRHAGNQLFMPHSFKELQEWDANLFTFYAAVPFHMLHFFDLHDKDVVKEISESFCVPEEFAYRRINFVLKKIKEYERYFNNKVLI